VIQQGSAANVSGARAPGPSSDLDSIVALMASELGGDSALLSIQDHSLGEAQIVSAWGLWRRLEPVADPYRPDASGRFRRDQPIADALLAAVRSPSGRAGALAGGFATRPDERREVAFEALSSYAALVGLWLDDAGALLRLVRAASHDPLTGCLSYTALMHELDREIRRAERGFQPLACLFVGVDGLEDASDDAGQQVANRVLIECAGRLMARARQTDLVGRHGGDDFVVRPARHAPRRRRSPGRCAPGRDRRPDRRAPRDAGVGVHRDLRVEQRNRRRRVDRSRRGGDASRARPTPGFPVARINLVCRQAQA
jgi:GGDEF domain-containing protein